MRASGLLSWYERHQRDLPWRRTHDPYAILVSEVMLQQTQVSAVLPYYERWMKAFPTLRRLAAAPERAVLRHWEGLGYYRRARNLRAAARLIVAFKDGDFPRTFDELLALPGVGRYTAAAVGSIALGLPLPVLDGNVARVLSRLLGIREPVKSARVRTRMWRVMEEWLPARRAGDFNQAMMELGATVCLPKNPRCPACPLAKGCVARSRNWQDKIPKPERAVRVDRAEYAVLARSREGVWLRQRGPGEWHEGFWAMPSVLRPAQGNGWTSDFKKRFGWIVEKSESVCSLRYQVTRHRVALSVFESVLPRHPPPELRAWRRPEIHRLPLVTSHRRSLERLGVI